MRSYPGLANLLVVLLLVVAGCVVLSRGSNATAAQGGRIGASARTLRYLPLVLRPPTPTVTKTPTATATATPRPQSIDIICLSQGKDEGSALTEVRGEVVNRTGQPVYSAVVAATFYDDAGMVKGVGDGYVAYAMLKPAEKCPFLVLAQAAEGWTRYEAAVVSYATSSSMTFKHDFAVVDVQSWFYGNTFFVQGNVRNDTTECWTVVHVTVSLYDAAGCLIGSGTQPVFMSDIPAGQMNFFQVSPCCASPAEIDHWSLGVEGRR